MLILHEHSQTGRDTYSQDGEDRIVAELLGKPLGEVKYLDIGCWQPIRHNNTFLFYEAGSSGVAVDGNWELYQLWQEQRPRDTFVSVVVAPRTSMVRFRTFADQHGSPFSTASRSFADLVEGGRYGDQKISDVQERFAVGINRALEFAAGIDFLSLDVEGLDTRVLRAVDWQVHRPPVVCAEHNGDYDADRVMEDAGYKLVARTDVNSIYTDRAFLSEASP